MLDRPPPPHGASGARAARAVETGGVTLDVLSEVLRAVRLSGAMYFEVSAAHPWVAVTPSMKRIGASMMPDAEHVIPFHIMVSGHGWAMPRDRSVRAVDGGLGRHRDVSVRREPRDHLGSLALGRQAAGSELLRGSGRERRAVHAAHDRRRRREGEVRVRLLGLRCVAVQPAARRLAEDARREGTGRETTAR